MELFENNFLQTLKQIHLMMKKRFRGQSVGSRITQRRGNSAEFADYREYQPGDDLRFIDWNLFARMEKLFIKLFHSEETVDLFIILDTSESMSWGETKSRYSRQLAGGLAFIALNFQDRVKIIPTTGGLERASGMLGGGGAIKSALGYISRLPVGRGSFDECIKKFTASHRRSSIIFLISDFLFDYQDALRRLNFHKHQVNLVQVLDPAEMQPDFLGHFQLQDIETDEELEIYLDPSLLDDYSREFQKYLDEINGFCKECRVEYHQASTEFPLSSLILNIFRMGNVR